MWMPVFVHVKSVNPSQFVRLLRVLVFLVEAMTPEHVAKKLCPH